MIGGVLVTSAGAGLVRDQDRKPNYQGFLSEQEKRGDRAQRELPRLCVLKKAK